MTHKAEVLPEEDRESSGLSERSPEPSPKTTQFTRRNAIIIGAYFFSVIAIVLLSYAVFVLWLPEWFPPPDESLFEFPHFTYTSEEQITTGEPVNLVLLADDGQQIVDVFQKVGLIHVGSMGQQSLKTTIVDALEKRITPISHRYLFGRAQDYAFQTHSDSVAHRHHLRVWRHADYTWDGKPIWLVSASYDQGLGLTLEGFLPVPTHILSPNLDDERNYLADLLMHHGTVSNRSRAPGVGPILFRSNGDFSFYFTDGAVVVLTLGEPTDGKPEVDPWHWSLRVRSKYFSVPTLFLQFLGLAHVYESPSAILREIEDAAQ